MYLPNQVIYDLDKKRAFQMSDDVWELSQYPKRHTHFIRPSLTTTRKRDKKGAFLSFFELYCPSSVEEAHKLLFMNLIAPAPWAPDHCWNCQAWLNGCKCGAERPANFYTLEALREGGL